MSWIANLVDSLTGGSKPVKNQGDYQHGRLTPKDPYKPALDFPNAGRGVGDSMPAAGSLLPQVQEEDPNKEILSNIMGMILGAGNGSSLSASSAAGAYNPLISALEGEKSNAIKRNKQNRQESAKDFKSIENMYRLERRNAVKNNVLAKEKLNKEIAANKTATRQEYTKQAAEHTAEMAGQGIGTSAQAMARQSLEDRAMEEANMQAAIGTENANNRREMQRSQEAYLAEQMPVARQSREEFDMGYNNKLEDILLALDKEKAGYQSKAAEASNSVRMSQQDNSLKKASSMMDLLRLTGELSGAGDGASGAPQFFPEGAAGANEWAKSYAGGNGIGNPEDVLGIIAGDKELQAGGFGPPENRNALNPANVLARVNEYAKQYKWTPAQRALALGYAERLAGTYGDRKNEPKAG